MVAKKTGSKQKQHGGHVDQCVGVFFADETISINRGENHYNSKHVECFEYADGVMRGNVHASMKNRTYKTTVSVKNLLID